MKTKSSIPRDDRRYNSDQPNKRVESAGVKVQSKVKAGPHFRTWDNIYYDF